MINLFDESTRKAIAEFIKGEQPRLSYNGQIFQILEGNLKPLLNQRMLDDLGPDSVKAAQTRTAPINVLEKVVDKQTSIYSGRVVRRVEGPNVTDSDRELLKWYEDVLDMNQKMSSNNEFFNAYQYALLQIALNIKAGELTGKPFIRSAPNHQFLVLNDQYSVDPTSPDLIILCIGAYKDDLGREHTKFALYTDQQYVIMNESGELLLGEMQKRDQDGTNPYGVTPFEYANASQNMVMPMVQTDNLDMALLIPLLLTDLNYAAKFQCFSLFVSIDIDDQKISISPNSILRLKSDPKGDKPDFKVIKPEVDISEVLNLAASEMGLWLSTKGIRPGTVGTVGQDNFASGVSKIIDESDTFESKNKQIILYMAFEKRFWDRLFRHIHPVWVETRKIENTALLSEGAYIVTEFEKPVPLQTRGEKVTDLDLEVTAGFISRKRAVAALNPDLSEDALEELMEEINEERVIREPTDEPVEVPEL